MNLRHLLAHSIRLTSPVTLAAGVALMLSCGGGGNTRSRELQVMSFAPEGVVDRAETIVIRFDQPVVDETMVSKTADQTLVKVAPAFAWNGFWQDQRTLVIDPTERLTPSTKYTVALQGELASRTKNFELSFVHRPIAVEGVAGVDPEMISPDGELPIAFNVPVTAVDVASHCKLTHASGDVGLVGMPGAPAMNVKVTPVRNLERGGAYTLTCEKLIGAGGNLPLAETYTLPLGVRPALEVTGVTPDKDDDVAADEVQLSFTFSTPVTLDAVRKAVRSQPTIPGLDQGYLGGDGLSYHVTTDLDTQTKYQLSLVGLVDTFGQKLDAAKAIEFKTGDARPRISMERGIYALEASAKGYPVWTRNIGKYEVECAAIPKERLVQVLTTDMNYDPWGGNNDDKPIDWKSIKVKPRVAGLKPSAKNKWLMDELSLGKTCAGADGMRGVFLAEVRSDEITPDTNRGWLSPRRNRVLANVTDMGVLIKAGTASGVVWVTSLSTGAPIGGATVTVYTPQGKQVHTGVSSADGLVKIPGTSVLKKQEARNGDDEGAGEFEDWDSYRSQRLIAVVENGKDLAVVDGNWANGIQLWNFGVTEDRRGGATKIRGFIQSDRGLYRPGESVHFKGIAREIKMGRAPSVPARAKPVEIEVQDSRGQTVLNTEAKLSSFGGFAFDMNLAEDASVGDYYVRAKVGDQTFREKFSVEEFRAATFEVKLASAAANPTPGEKLRFDLDAKYLMGSPATAANVEWNLRKRAHRVRFKGYDAFTFSANPQEWYWYEPSDDYGDFISDGNGKTNAQGRLTIEARDTAKAFTGPVDYILSANVTDSADQTMGKSTIVTAHKTQFYLGLHANEFVQAVGMPFGVNIVALDPDGKQRGTKAKLTMTRTVHSCMWEQLGSRSFQKCESSPKKMIEREITIAGAGSHSERIYPTEPGDYVIQVQAKDALGNEVTAASQIWVIGKGEAFWSGDEGARMTLVASKPTYVAGDTARLVAQANLVKPTALITIERDGVIDAKVKKLGAASEGLELKIDDAWAPNVYAGVALVQGRQGVGDKHRPQFKMGVVELKVASDHKQLDVKVDLDNATVRPGDKVTGKIVVTKNNKPIKAEVSLSAADEGVLQLISYATPNPMKTFYASYGLGVDAGTNWNRVARIADPTKGDPDEGGDGGSELSAQRVRSKFVSSAYWQAMLVTNDKGEIPFTFDAPDNLTAFRLMAVAADVSDQFGAGEKRLTVNKPVMAAPALPRFLRSGDAASVGIVIHNNTDTAGKAVVTAKADGATLDATQQIVDIGANSSQRVRFAAKASDNAAATFEFSVAVGNDKAGKDAVRVTVPIDRPRVIDNRLVMEKTFGTSQGGSWTGQLGVSSDVLRNESALSITIDRTGVGDLAPGLRSLVEYPYGCLEQTMSRFIPLVAAKDLANTLDDPSLKGTKATSFIKAGTAKVIRHQQGDGHWSLWPQSQTYPHLTAYAMWGLTVAQQSGEQIPPEVFDNGIRALQQWANKGAVKPDGDGAVMAMGAYVMALRGKPDTSLNARLYAVRSGLPKWGQAFLLRALHQAKADPAQIAEVKKLVEAGITVDGTQARALVREGTGKDPSYHYHYMHSDIRASAMTLAAMLEVDPQSKLVDKLAAGIKASRNGAGDWVSTQETLWSLVSLADYGKRATGGETTATIRVGGKQIGNRKITGAEIASFKLPLGEVAGDKLELTVTGTANVSVRVRESRVDAMAPVSNGFELKRVYLDAKGAEVASFKAGDMVTVKLELTTKAAQQWVALVDPIPAGFEVVNPKLAAGGAQQPNQPTNPDPWARRWGYVTWDHQELRDDRVQWFADRMGAGNYQMTYQARATIDGSFSAMPATVEAMYQPDVRARTARQTITVTK
jgi:uncharacterized protein YfaS (alpha-2-macroglobulin family)